MVNSRRVKRRGGRPSLNKVRGVSQRRMTDAMSTRNFPKMRRVHRKVHPNDTRKMSSVKRTTHNVEIHRRNFPRTKYYLTSGHEHMGKPRNVNDEQSPFIFPSCSLMFAYFQYWKARKRKSALERREASYKEQHNYNTMQTRDLLQRLRVDVEIEEQEAKKHKDPDEAIAMTDVDPHYFTELAGRAVKEKFSLRQYIEDTRDVFRTRLLAGQKVDDCIRIEQQFDEEQRRLDKIKRQYSRYVSGFEEFLSRDHQRSMEVLEKAEYEAKLTNQITEKRNRLTKEFGQVRLDVYFWEESWRMVKMCQKFLYLVSPISWRTEYDWVNRSKSKQNVISANNEDLFGRYRMADEVASLETLIQLFEQDIADAGPADIYFQDPFDLIRIFRSMETQNLNALIHLESLAAPMSDMATTIVTAEEQIKSEVDEIVEAIEELEDSIRKTEARAADLEEYANHLLEGVFRDLVCSQEVLCLQVFVEDTYESCVGMNDANLDSFSMMKWIERIHEDLNLELDTLPPAVVQACEKEGFRNEMKAMKETEEAAKKFELMHRLLAALKRIMEPPVTKRRQLMWRSTPIQRKGKPIPPPPMPTDEEMQYLTFFTNYCQQDDFTAYRSQFPDDFDLTFEPTNRESIELLASEIEDTEVNAV